MDKKRRPSHMLLTETHFTFKDIHRMKVKEWNKIFYANEIHKKNQE
jgi:hypothetical protein